MQCVCTTVLVEAECAQCFHTHPYIRLAWAGVFRERVYLFSLYSNCSLVCCGKTISILQKNGFGLTSLPEAVQSLARCLWYPLVSSPQPRFKVVCCDLSYSFQSCPLEKQTKDQGRTHMLLVPYAETGKCCSRLRAGIIIMDGRAVLRASEEVSPHRAFPRSSRAHLFSPLLQQ